MKKKVQIIVGIGILLFVVIQIIRPERISTDAKRAGDITNVLNVPANVAGILERSCYDCHSFNTVWPWYSNISPVSWMVAKDVTDGRKQVNFSLWEDYSPMLQMAKLSLVSHEVETKVMPLARYTLIHPNAKLSDDEIQTVSDWAKKQMELLKSQ